MNKRTINFVTMAIPLVVMAVALLASPASVKGQEAEIEAVRKKIKVLLKEADRLQDEGAADKAERLVKQAQELKVRLAKSNEDPGWPRQLCCLGCEATRGFGGRLE